MSKAGHPGLITWDIIFKGSPIGIYFFSYFIGSTNGIIIRLSCITILTAIEFWFTKNILGRVLVGLKWSRVIEENGEEYLKFETKRSEEKNNNYDYNFFWGLLVLSFMIWLVLFFFNIWSFSNLIVIFIPLILIGTNIYCFYKCSKK